MRCFIRLILFLLLGTDAVTVYSQTVTVLQPSLYQVAGNNVLVRVSITPATPDTVYVQNDVNFIKTGLPYDSASATYSGLVPLTGLPDDTLALYITVSDKQNHLLRILTRTIIHDSLLQTIPGPAPQLVISSPLPYSVARPVLPFKAKAISSMDSCRLLLTLVSYPSGAPSYTVIGQYLDSIDTDLDLSPYEGTGLSFIVQATDKNNQTANSGLIPVFVESSPHLIQYFAAEDKILDFNYNKILVAEDGRSVNPRIIDVPGGSSLAIPYHGGPIDHGYMTVQGAVFSVAPYGFASDSLYDFNNGSLYFLGTCNQGSVKVAGNYCIWMNNDPLTGADTIFLRDLAAGTNSIVTSNATDNTIATSGSIKNDVAADGTVVYVDSTGNIVKYINNSYTTITSSAIPFLQIGTTNPLTDGYNIAYLYFDHTNDQIIVNGANGLSTPVTRTITPMPGTDYQVNNKYIAYIHSLDDLHAEARVVDPTGVSSLVQSSLIGGCQLDLLNPKGDLMFLNGGRKLAAWNQPAIKIGSALGKTLYRDSTWYIAIGRVLFKLYIDISPDSVHNSAVIVATDSFYTFKATDFRDHFTGPGHLLTIKITSLPPKGTLQKAGIPVNVNDEIALADLGTLRYIPDTLFVGMDTLRWNAFDGIAYTASDAQLLLHVEAPPVRPQFGGSEASYCANQGSQKIKILHLPDRTDESTVEIKLDSLSEVVGADSSISFNPGDLSSGPHSIVAIFKNSVGVSSDTLYFTIQEPVTPIVKLSSDNTAAKAPATLTATNVAGGGTAPVYLFARDRNFVNILQAAASANNKLVVTPPILSLGDNFIYVRMTTSESCYTVQTSVDSIDISGASSIGIIDPDYPEQVISIYPNPFKDPINISGLNTMKDYIITLRRMNGQVFLSRAVIGQSSLVLFCPQAAPGVYLLSIYDQKKNKTLGTVKLLKE